MLDQPVPPPTREKPEVIIGGGGPAWHERTKDGPAASYRNAQIALTCLGAVFSYDEFRHRSFVLWRPFGGAPVEVGDYHAIKLRKAMTVKYNFDPQKEHTNDAIATLCHENRFDPVRDYLNRVSWDGQRRIDMWLTYYLGVADSPLVREFARKTLIAAVRRVRQPGCKFDYILVLEGEQGAGKSSALKILAGDPDFFTDQDMLHLDVKGQQEAIAGKWIVELAELAGMRRTEVERVKAFASRQFDRARGAYARFTIDQPRRCIMIGTTNANEYLSDPTGNRRFWPVRVESIDLDGLREDRDQLWAEASRAEATGEALELDPDLYGDARSEQAKREEHDPWEDILREIKVRPDVTDGIQRILSRELLGGDDKLNLPKEKHNSVNAQRLRRCMNRLGWDGPGPLPRVKSLMPETGAVAEERGRARGYWRENPT